MVRLLPLFLLLLVVPVYCAPTTLTVSPKGPVTSLQAARDEVRKLRADGKAVGPVRIEVQPGTYCLTEPLVFQPQDSDLTFVGLGKQRPLISAGQIISGWKQQGPGLWVAPVADAANWPLRSLYVNGERAILARSPNTGYFRTVG
ncbi:MAG: hypothetical protein WCP21_12405, partial [Armatimonadota bacterium]